MAAFLQEVPAQGEGTDDPGARAILVASNEVVLHTPLVVALVVEHPMGLPNWGAVGPTQDAASPAREVQTDLEASMLQA